MAPRRLALFSCCACFILLIIARWIGRERPQPPPAANAKLHSLYHTLRQRLDPDKWPDRVAAEKLWRGLHRTSNGSVQPNRFVKDGPLQVTVFFRQVEEFEASSPLAIVHEARKRIFVPLVAELRAGLRPRSQQVLDRGLWVPADGALHIIVKVFSEHPSLLEPEEAKSWRPVSEEQCEALGGAIEQHLSKQSHSRESSVENESRSVPAKWRLGLRVWGYVLTADGSMLVLFEEAPSGGASSAGAATPAAASFVALREELAAVGEAVLGPLNSRPKDLIHVSAMRLLEWPAADDLDAAERAHVASTVRAWANALADDRLPNGRPVPNIGATVRAISLELVRDEPWMMTHRKTYRSFCLGNRVRTGGCNRKRHGKRICWTGKACVWEDM
jgi:hypothetical protein